NGSFIINNIPDGRYVLTINFYCYEPYFDSVIIKGNTLTQRIMLIPSKTMLDAVQVSGEAQQRVQEPRVSVMTVTPKEMTKMPSIGGQPDFAQYLQVLPGVVSTGDQGGQLYIRGGTPAQNLVLLDGMLIFSPFHSIGLFSVFDVDIISMADVYTGGFGAEYGGRTSSVMDVRTRDGNKRQLSGNIGINTFGAKMLLEGPLVKLKENRNTSLSFLLSAKGSFLEYSTKLLYPYVKQGLPYNYMDYYAKISLAAKGGTKWNLFGYYFDDQVNYSDVAAYKWTNLGVGTNFLIVPGQVPMTIDGSVTFSYYTTGLEDKLFFPKQSTLRGFTANMNFSYFVGRSVFKVGFDLLGYKTIYQYYNSAREKFTPEDNTTDLGLYVKYKYNFKDKLLIEPSFRLQYYASLSAVSPEPRIAVKYNITNKIRLKLAGGLYSQNYVAISSDQDVVNLFYGFLSSPEDMPVSFDGKEINRNLQKAQHAILGLEIDVLRYTSINIEGFFKNFSQLISPNRYQLFDNTSTNNAMPDYLRRDYMWEKGMAYGSDITVKFEYKSFYFWAAYTLSWTTRYDGQQHYKPHFDRRHNLNILLSYACGKRKSWQFDVRWNYGSGFPFTQTQVFYPLYTFPQINSNYVNDNETLSFLLGDLNQGQLPAYHRLDVSAKKKFFLGKRHTLELALSATNVYNYSNVFYVNRITNKVIYQLPILYNFGISWHF
ncbi:MAG: TonB-dependent receptor, partial [Bacteroidales bacterium]|nr:TonB-dependent receptor [Bacteroidales bacterium]